MTLPVRRSLWLFALVAASVAVPVVSTVAWAMRGPTSASVDDIITCRETFGCAGGPARCVEVMLGELKLICNGTVSET
jgi:hypothetical protein